MAAVVAVVLCTCTIRLDCAPMFEGQFNRAAVKTNSKVAGIFVHISSITTSPPFS